MAQSKYAKYIVTEPICEFRPSPGVEILPPEKITGRNAPIAQYMSNRLVSNCGVLIGMFWVWAIPNTVAVKSHSHPFDEVIIYAGSDPENPRELGGEIEFQMGDETHTIDKTAAIFIPKGLPHAPFIYKRVDNPDKPILHIAIVLGGESSFV